LPSQGEFQALVTAIGGTAEAKKLKADDDAWNARKGTDDYGFSALPGGYGTANGSFQAVGYSGYWWSGTPEKSGSNAYRMGMWYGNDNVTIDFNGRTSYHSIRCIQN
jgi:uncharacterized protein (TIGR02145 family)